MAYSRRSFIRAVAAAAGAGIAGCAAPGAKAGSARVVVVGAGFGGGTAAKYLKMWAPDIDVALVERERFFVSCPLSNLVIGGNARLADISVGYDGLRARGVRLIRDEAIAVDPVRREVRLASGTMLGYDRLIVSPGVAMLYDTLPGLKSPAAQARVLHAWRAGQQTVALRSQLEAMRDGGVFAIHIPRTPFRCPPGPYERVCQVADYFRKAKPRSKIIVLDTNEDLASKKALFLAAWNGLYKGMIDYRPNSEIVDVDAATLTAKLQFDDVKADVLNVVPPNEAGAIARSAGLLGEGQHWCAIDWLTYESSLVKGVHVLGDSTLAAPGMPKSASMANQHGKICAAAVIALLKGSPVPAAPVAMNTCYSFVDGRNVMHVASIHQYDAAQRTMIPVKGAGGLSDKASELEGTYAWGWARNIWGDSLV